MKYTLAMLATPHVHYNILMEVFHCIVLNSDPMVNLELLFYYSVTLVPKYHESISLNAIALLLLFLI